MIKIMSFNIRYGKADDGINRWENRRELALSRIHAFAPDLIGMQECRDDDQAAYVKDHLPEYHFLSWRRGGEGDSAFEMAPILFKKDVFELSTSGVFWLSETPEQPGSKSWGATFPRTAIWAKLLHLSTNKTLTFVNTHFDYQSSALENSAACLGKWIRDNLRSEAAVLCGDFNAMKDSAPYLTLIGQSSLIDAHRQVKFSGDENTFHGFGMETGTIDWILVSDHFQVRQADIDRTQDGNKYPSDHYPITALLDWKNS